MLLIHGIPLNFSGFFHRVTSQPGMLHALGLMLVLWGIGIVRKVQVRITQRSARYWPTETASIDVVSAVEQITDKDRYYSATLTYFYRNPDLQMGEYERRFDVKAAAQQWVEQFKGRQVQVHVDPRHPERSVLLEEAVEQLTVLAPTEGDAALALERFPRLPRPMLALSAVAEGVGLIGFAVSVAQFLMSLHRGGQSAPEWMAWVGGTMLAFGVVAFFVVLIKAEGEDRYDGFQKNYLRWAPAWMRWILSASSACFFLLWFANSLAPELIRQIFAGTAAFGPILFFAWGFLLQTAFHAAILRTQQQTGTAAVVSASD